MATDSRSGLELLVRLKIIDEPVRPTPRLCIEDLLVERLPLDDPPLPSRDVMRRLEGTPQPDRQGTRPWPGDP